MRVEKGFVTLTGIVEWHYQHDEIARSIRTLSGITGVANQITVAVRPNTSEIQNDIQHAMHRYWYLADHIGVSTKGGEVHLSGRADSWYDRNRCHDSLECARNNGYGE